MTSIVIVQPHLRYGGAERQTVLVANELVRQGHTCHVILHSKDGGLVGDLSPGVFLHELGHKRHVATLFIARKLKKILREIEPSFVIVKLWSSILAASMVDQSLRQHVFNYCEDLDPRDHADYIRFGRLKQRMIRRIFRSRQLLTANTHTVASSMVETYGLASKPDVIASTVQPSVIRTLMGDPASLMEKDDERIDIISVGSLIPRKGLGTTLAALQLLDRKVNWHVVGVGPLTEELSDFEDPAGNVRVILHGGTPAPYGLMAAADVLVHSAPSEAFGIVLLEAMAAGTPVIAADAIGPVEMRKVLGHNDEFLTLYRKSDANDLAQALTARLADGRPTAIDAKEYIAPYSLENSVRLWVERAQYAGIEN
ncbi:glycosyltransferase [Salinibacterium sp. ZJ454]|uniref:glycosyltransferase n=1 Tax=Salinibacterium sp. ZJ454 TaxID=2708339 RepID=UPI001FBB3763|nr:glycosyltransferase [Salinibacterium sp. ZJ454]